MPAGKVYTKETVDKLIADQPQVVVAVTFGLDKDFNEVLPSEFPSVTFICLDYDHAPDRDVAHALGITNPVRIFHYVNGKFVHQDTGDRVQTLKLFRGWLAEEVPKKE